MAIDSGSRREREPASLQILACILYPNEDVNWLVWIGLAMLVAAVAAVTGIKPRGSRPVAHTRLMGAGRIVLFVIVAIVAYLAYRAA